MPSPAAPPADLLPPTLAAAVAALTLTTPKSPTAAAALDAVFAASYFSSPVVTTALTRDLETSPISPAFSPSHLPPAVFPYLAAALATFAASHPADLLHADFDRGCSLSEAVARAAGRESFAALLVGRGHAPREARKGLYALLKLAVSGSRESGTAVGGGASVPGAVAPVDARGSKSASGSEPATGSQSTPGSDPKPGGWKLVPGLEIVPGHGAVKDLDGPDVRPGLARLQICITKAICTFLSAGGMPQKPSVVRTAHVLEVFNECHEDLVAFLMDERIELKSQEFALRTVAILAGCYAPSPLGIVRLSSVFGVAIVTFINRCEGRAGARALLREALSFLSDVLLLDGEAEGFADVLRSHGFRTVLRIVQRELLKMATEPPGVRTPEGELDSRSDDIMTNEAMAQVCAELLQAIHLCAPAWEAAAVVRKTAYALVALLLRQRFAATVAIGCEILADAMEEICCVADTPEWTCLVQDAFIDGGCYSALLVSLRQPMTDPIFYHRTLDVWSCVAGLIVTLAEHWTQVEEKRDIFDKLRGAETALPTEKLLGKDEAFIRTVVSDVIKLCVCIEAAGKDIPCDCVSTLNALLAALMASSSDPAVISEEGATQPVLRTLISLLDAFPESAGSEDATNGLTVDLAMKTYERVVQFLHPMSENRNKDHFDFLAVEGGTEAVIAAILVVPGEPLDGAFLRKTSSEKVRIGMCTLGHLALNDDLRALIAVSEMEDGGGVLALARSMISKTQWSKDAVKDDAASDAFLSEQGETAVSFLKTMLSYARVGGDDIQLQLQFQPERSAIAREYACDEFFVKGLLKALALGDSNMNGCVFDKVFETFGTMTDAFLDLLDDPDLDSAVLDPMLTETLEMWLRAGVFSIIPPLAAAFYSDSHENAFFAGMMVSNHCCFAQRVRGDGSKTGDDYRIGQAAFQTLRNAGALAVLELYEIDNRSRCGTDGCESCLARAVILDELTALRMSKTSRGVGIYARELDQERLKLTNDSSSVSGRALRRNLRKKCKQKLRKCANSECRAVRTADFRLKKCTCGAESYCSVACQTAHWPHHKHGCSARKVRCSAGKVN